VAVGDVVQDLGRDVVGRAADGAAPLARAVERGLLDTDPSLLRPSPLGTRCLNDLQQLFLV
jgi:hypothetical protein